MEGNAFCCDAQENKIGGGSSASRVQPCGVRHGYAVPVNPDVNKEGSGTHQAGRRWNGTVRPLLTHSVVHPGRAGPCRIDWRVRPLDILLPIWQTAHISTRQPRPLTPEPSRRPIPPMPYPLSHPRPHRYDERQMRNDREKDKERQSERDRNMDRVREREKTTNKSRETRQTLRTTIILSYRSYAGQPVPRCACFWLWDMVKQSAVSPGMCAMHPDPPLNCYRLERLPHTSCCYSS